MTRGTHSRRLCTRLIEAASEEVPRKVYADDDEDGSLELEFCGPEGEHLPAVFQSIIVLVCWFWLEGSESP